MARQIGTVGIAIRLIYAGLTGALAVYLWGLGDLLAQASAVLLAFISLSLLIAVVKGWSGCEVAALLSALTGRRIHFVCIAGLDSVDAWEKKRKTKAKPRRQ